MKKIIGSIFVLVSIPTALFLSSSFTSSERSKDDIWGQLSSINWGLFDSEWSNLEDDYYEESDDLEEGGNNTFTLETLSKNEYLNDEERDFVSWGNGLEIEEKKILVDYLRKENSFSSLDEAKKILEKLKRRRDRKEAEEFFFNTL